MNTLLSAIFKIRIERQKEPLLSIANTTLKQTLEGHFYMT